MSNVDIIRKGFKCNRCGAEFIPRFADKIPVACPKCRSIWWNKPRKRRLKNKTGEVVASPDDAIRNKLEDIIAEKYQGGIKKSRKSRKKAS